MNNKGRVENSIRNSVLGVTAQAANVLLGLIVRTFFIRCLSREYLGVNGLFSNILTMLSLAELGIGTAIIYNMYKPIADKDEKKISELMNFYRQAYRIIGLIVAAIGLCVTPFLDYIIKDKPNISNLVLIYLLYLSNTVLSYFFAYKRSIFSADQKEGILHIFRLIFYIIRTAAQILILLILRDFIMYLLVQIICTFLENVCVSLYADKEYKFLRKYKHEKLPKKERSKIFKNIKALFIYKIGSTALDGTDNIIISAFDGIISVGLFSNYTLVTSSVQLLLYQGSNSITGSIGNFIAKEKEERYEELLDKITFFNFIIYGGAFVALTACMSPFIRVWAGEEYVLGFSTVFVHSLNLYIYGMMNSIWAFRSTMGLFMYGKWRPMISAVINIVVSILFAQYWGLLGVLLGTTFTRVVTNVWYDPYIVYKYGLKKKPYKYFAKWIVYLVIVCCLVFIIRLINQFVVLSGLADLLFNAALAAVLFVCTVVIIFRKTSSFNYFCDIIKSFIKRIKK